MINQNEISVLSLTSKQLYILNDISVDGQVALTELILKSDTQLNKNKIEYCLECLTAKHNILKLRICSLDGKEEPVFEITNQLNVRVEDVTVKKNGQLLLKYHDNIEQFSFGIEYNNDTMDVRLWAPRYFCDYNSMLIITEDLFKELDKQCGRIIEKNQIYYHYTDIGDSIEDINEYDGIISPYDLSLEFEYGDIKSVKKGHKCVLVDITDKKENILKLVDLYCCWVILMHRWSISETIGINYLIENRNFDEVQSIIGPFSRYIPVTMTCTDDTTVISLKNEIERYLTDIENISQNSEEYLQQDVDRNALNMGTHYPIAFEFIKSSKYPYISDKVKIISSSDSSIKLKLAVHVGKKSNSLYLQYDYSRFSQEAVIEMARQYRDLIANIANMESNKIGEISTFRNCNLYCEKNIHFTHKWKSLNNTPSEIDLFEDICRKNGPRIAVYTENRTYTYRDLSILYFKYLDMFKKHGVGYGSRVILLMERCCEFLASCLAVQKLKATFLPISTSANSKHLLYIIADAKVGFVVSDNTVSDLFEGWISLKLSGEYYVYRNNSLCARKAHITCDTNYAAYIIYTSGTTGYPKGCVIGRQSLGNVLQFMHNKFYSKCAINILFKTAISFDASIWEYMLPLTHGGSLVIYPDGQESDMEKLAFFVKNFRINSLQIVPSLLPSIFSVNNSSNYSGLKKLFCGGEKLSVKLLSHIPKHLNLEIINLYGPTETTIQASYMPVTNNDKSISIGSPIGNQALLVVDQELNCVRPGVVGEIVIVGCSVGLGYTNSVNTAVRFYPDPFSEIPGQRMFKTGDNGVIDTNGNLYFISRKDRQLKVNGHRIEPEGIETLLEIDDSVSKALVDMIEINGTKQLVGFIITATGFNSDYNVLANRLAENLPRYMVPTVFHQLEYIPRLANGKIDRESLSKIFSSHEYEVVHESGTESEIEDLLLKVISKALCTNMLTVTDNIFRYGFDSILGIRIISDLRGYKLDLSLQKLYEHGTVRNIAPHMTSLEKSSDFKDDKPFSMISVNDRSLISSEIEDAYPVATVHKAIYYIDRSSDKYEAYITSLLLKGDLEPLHLAHALQKMIDKHEWLRTSFDFTSFDEPLQLINKNICIPLEVVDQRHKSFKSGMPYFVSWVERQKKFRFEWNCAPVWKFVIHRWSGNHSQLTLVEPNFDGWSVSSFFTELLEYYKYITKGEKIVDQITTERAKYKQFIQDEKRILNCKAAKTYWFEKLKGMNYSSLEKATFSSNIKNTTQRHLLEISSNTLERLKKISNHNKIPLKNILFAIHCKVISLFCNSTDITTGMVVNGRPEEIGSDKTLGLFINFLPIRIIIESTSWIELARLTLKEETEALLYRQYPYAEIKKIFNNNTLFETAFNFTNFHIYEKVKNLDFLEVIDYIAWDQTYYDFTVQCHYSRFESKLFIALDYNSQQFDEAYIAEIASYYQKYSELFSQYPLQNNINDNYNNKDSIIANHICESYRDVIMCFDDHVNKYAKNTALTIGEEHISYQQLGDKVNSIASKILAIGGIKQKKIIVMCRFRKNTVISLLSILKSSMVYVPVDYTLAPERIKRVIEEVRSEIIITEKHQFSTLHFFKGEIIDIEHNHSDLNHFKYSSESCSLSYILFTSGSGGVPKGVQIQRAALNNVVGYMQKMIGIKNHHSILSNTNVMFDISILEMLLAFSAGARLVLTHEEEYNDSYKLISLINREKIDFIQATPSVYRSLIETGLLINHPINFICGGEALSNKLAQQLLAIADKVWNLYGPTETTIWSSAQLLDNVNDKSVVSIGTPIANTEFYILDNFMNPVPRGVIGELNIAGVGLSMGYWRNSIETAKSFLPNPFSRNYSTMYRTGDKVKLHINGSIEYIDRLDNQLKIRGYRIEPSEIEYYIKKIDGIDDAIVLKELNSAKFDILVGYILISNSKRIKVTGIKEILKLSLPSYMIPEVFNVLTEFPYNSRGKVDRLMLKYSKMTGNNSRKLESILNSIENMDTRTVKETIKELS